MRANHISNTQDRPDRAAGWHLGRTRFCMLWAVLLDCLYAASSSQYKNLNIPLRSTVLYSVTAWAEDPQPENHSCKRATTTLIWHGGLEVVGGSLSVPRARRRCSAHVQSAQDTKKVRERQDEPEFVTIAPLIELLVRKGMP